MFEISNEDYWMTAFPEYGAYIRRPLTAKEKMHVEIYKTLNWSILYGAQGMGKNYAAAQKVRENVARMRNGNIGNSFWTEDAKPQMPQKICNYRKPKLYWFGEAGNNVPYSVGSRSTHWAVVSGMLDHRWLEGYYSTVGDTVETYKPMGTTTGRFANADPFKGRRLIGISEPTEIETRTLDGSTKAWEPKGELFVMSGKPLKINDKSKETIERVKDITYP